MGNGGLFLFWNSETAMKKKKMERPIKSLDNSGLFFVASPVF
jgi:hypothetical protein